MRRSHEHSIRFLCTLDLTMGGAFLQVCSIIISGCFLFESYLVLLWCLFWHQACVKIYTSCYHLAEYCVFIKQSLPPHMFHFPNPKRGGRAPLLPKLRGHFFKLLHHGSLKHPSILYLFTCVGLGYGQFTGTIGFPIQCFSSNLKP